jgi:hypothetical protein
VKRSGILVFALLLFAFEVCAYPGPKTPTKKKGETSQVVDAGSFGIFIDGKRVATETFQIHEYDGYSVTSSELKMEDGSKATQQGKLEVLSNGNLRKYEWHELSPGKARATVQPSEQFLIERLSTEGSDKPIELAFILPPSTSVVDDYFFSHREVLLWRYIAAGCGQPSQNNQCRLGKSQFGVFVPRQQTPTMVTLEYKGSEKVQIRGAERQLDRFDLDADGLNWSFWVDSADRYKLVRILVASEKTEVVRD